MTTITLTIPVSPKEAKGMKSDKKLLEKIGAEVIADYVEIQQDQKLKKQLADHKDFADLSAKLKTMS